LTPVSDADPESLSSGLAIVSVASFFLEFIADLAQGILLAMPVLVGVDLQSHG
jgi:hypothetical protein